MGRHSELGHQDLALNGIEFAGSGLERVAVDEVGGELDAETGGIGQAQAAVLEFGGLDPKIGMGRDHHVTVLTPVGRVERMHLEDAGVPTSEGGVEIASQTHSGCVAMSGNRDAVQFAQVRDLDEIGQSAHECSVDLGNIEGGVRQHPIPPFLQAG